MTGIKDSVLGHIRLTKVQKALVEDPNMQRLRYIKQTGFNYLIYPGANHTRFEHSLGTLQITREMIDQTDRERMEELECVGLLHDIGHAAFSHNSDMLLKKYLSTNHEKLGEQIIKKGSIKDIIQDSTLSMKKLISYFNGEAEGEVVTGAFGSDRIDYLVRDSHYCGVNYGLIDYHNIRDKFTIYKNKPAIKSQAYASAENFLLARYSMFTTVYYHHAALIAEGMYEKAVGQAIDSKAMHPYELKSLNDWQMISRLTEIKASRPLVTRLLERRLFKRVFSDYVYQDIKVSEIEDAIQKCGLKEGEYVVKLSKLKFDGTEVMILNKNGKEVGKLSEISPLIETLTGKLSKRKKLVVACDSKNVTKMQVAVEKAI